MHVGETTIRYVNSFKYLGVVLPTNGRSFSEHIVDRVRRALVATVGIRTPARLSLKTALILFNMKIAPVAAYGYNIIDTLFRGREVDRGCVSMAYNSIE